MYNLSKEDRELVKPVPFVITVPKTYEEFCEKIANYDALQTVIYLKRMRDYNSFIADQSKKEEYIQINKFVLRKCDSIIKEIKYKNLTQTLEFLEAYYKHIHEMASALPDVYVEFIKNKLNAYMALIQMLSDENSENVLPKVFQKDIFFFTKIALRVLDLKRNPKVMQTIVLIVNNLVSKIKIVEFSDACFLLSLSTLLLESVCNKQEFRGKYLP